MRSVAALYIDPRGPYPQLPGVDAWDAARDARLYDGPHPVVAHPPCGPWSSLRHLHRSGGSDMAQRAVEQVRELGGRARTSGALEAMGLRDDASARGTPRRTRGHDDRDEPVRLGAPCSQTDLALLRPGRPAHTHVPACSRAHALVQRVPYSTAGARAAGHQGVLGRAAATYPTSVRAVARRAGPDGQIRGLPFYGQNSPFTSSR